MALTALVTGASSGIGREFARLHAEKGGHLVLVARRKKELDLLKKELESAHGVSIITIAADLSKEPTPKKIMDRLVKDKIEIDILINNAGFGGRGLFVERDWAADRDMIQVNIVALSALTHLILPQMIARKKGYILNVSSTAALIPGPLQAVYYATKAFVTSFSNALFEELRGTGVSVTALMPGATATEFGAVSGMDKTALFAQAVSPRKVAQAGYDAMLRGDLEVISGLPVAQKFMMRVLMPFLPKQKIMQQIRAMQEV